MPPKRAAATKTESPSRRKGGRPKKMDTDETGDGEQIAETELAEGADPVEEEEITEESATPKRRGRPRRSKSAAAVAEETEDGEELPTITLNIDDIIDLPATSNKKRKAPTKSTATKKGKSDTSMREVGGGGDGENLIQCTLCDARVVQLVRHIRAQHGDDPDYDSKIKEARSLEAKVQSHTPRKTGSNLLDDLTITVGKMAKEPIVDRRTIPGERGNSLVRPKNTQCPICEKVVRRYDLNKHIRNVHSGEKPNKCPYCDYASPWKGNLNTHIAGVHTKARLHDCIRCGLSFKTRSAMIGHVRKVHDKMYQPKERLFECEECFKKFYKKFHLQRHIRVHTGEKPFVCAFCEKMFASKTNMDSHIQSVHLKIKPFKCGYCEKGFARKKMMLLHIRKHHMNKDSDNTIGLANMIDIDDVTLDDNLDNESNASIESGEILGGGDSGMVLIKMRDDGAGESDDPVKQYMFVPANDLPSDLDNTLDTTAADRTTDSIDESMDTSTAAAASTSAAAEDQMTKETPATAITPAVANVEKAPLAAATTSQPVVINVAPTQVVQAVQTSEGIMLVTQSATITDNVDNTTTVIAPPPSSATNGEGDGAAVEATDTTVNDTNQSVAKESTQEADTVSSATTDLVQQALSETLPEVTAAGDGGEQGTNTKESVINSSSDLTVGLPANLLASEEGEQTNGEVETFYIKDLQNSAA